MLLRLAHPISSGGQYVSAVILRALTADELNHSMEADDETLALACVTGLPLELALEVDEYDWDRIMGTLAGGLDTQTCLSAGGRA